MISDPTTATASELIQNWEQEKRIKAMKDEDSHSVPCGCALHEAAPALYSALKELLTYGVEFDDPRLDYVVAHVDRDAIYTARAVLSLVEEKQ